MIPIPQQFLDYFSGLQYLLSAIRISVRDTTRDISAGFEFLVGFVGKHLFNMQIELRILTRTKHLSLDFDDASLDVISDSLIDNRKRCLAVAAHVFRRTAVLISCQ